jgi:N-methylhydantoinase A
MSSCELGWRVGIDTGGTFTDLVAMRGSELRTAKLPSTPSRFAKGVLVALAAAEVSPPEIDLLAHGTTAATRAIITKTGGRNGLITTWGLHDLLELRRDKPRRDLQHFVGSPTIAGPPRLRAEGLSGPTMPVMS